MDLSEQSPTDNIRKIEDIIDMQKANGSYRQVAFSLPTEAESTSSTVGGGGGARDPGGGAGAGLARSLESGLARPTRARALSLKKKPKKLRHKRRKSPLPDVISWPSDSDITVLRMKLCLTEGAGGGAGGAEGAGGAGGRLQTAGDVVPGDGLHQPDDSSMVNLATLVLHSRSPSKRSINVEEYLLPLSSWERAPPPPMTRRREDCSPMHAAAECKVFGATCSHSFYPDKLSTKVDQAGVPKASARSKVAKFLRLYFCPCCTCLYEMEKMREEPSEYVMRRHLRAPSPPCQPRPPAPAAAPDVTQPAQP